jgi:hypothetical protein
VIALASTNSVTFSTPTLVGGKLHGMNTQSILPYGRQWQEYRKRRNLLAFAFIGYIPVVGSFGYGATRVLHTEMPFYVLASCWLAFFAVSAVWFQLFKCPRCGKRYFFRSLYRNPLSSRCLHCGLQKYSNSASA